MKLDFTQKEGDQVPSLPLSDEEAKEALDYYEGVFDQVESLRETVQEVPVQDRLYGPVHAFSDRDHGIGEQHYLSQRATITAGRVGDAMFPAYNGSGNSKARVLGICVCGEGHDVCKQTLRGMVMRQHEAPLYYLDLNPDQRSPYVCPHIREGLTRLFPVHFRAWESMRRALGRMHREDIAVPLEQLAQFDPETLRKDCGLLRFIQAVGPETKGSSLYHVGATSDQRPETYRWKQSRKIKDRSKSEQILSGRYDAIMQRCRREGIASGWKDRDEFIEDALAALPEGCKVEEMRLRFEDAAKEGFNRRTMKWVGKRLRERKRKGLGDYEKGLMTGVEMAFKLQDGTGIEEAYEEAVKVVGK